MIQCVMKASVCNHWKNCWDGSDEYKAGCGTSICLSVCLYQSDCLTRYENDKMYIGLVVYWLGYKQGRRHGFATPLLPEVVPEIDANPVSFYGGGSVRFGAIILLKPPPPVMTMGAHQLCVSFVTVLEL